MNIELWEAELWMLALCLRAGGHVSWAQLSEAFDCLGRAFRARARA